MIAQEILETFRTHDEPDDLDINLDGKDVIRQLDSDFDDLGTHSLLFQ